MRVQKSVGHFPEMCLFSCNGEAVDISPNLYTKHVRRFYSLYTHCAKLPLLNMDVLH